MITSVIVMLGGESLLLGSWPVADWMLVFFFASIAFMRVEEPGLERRLEDYRRYKANVPPWIPRVTPWQPSEDCGAGLLKVPMQSAAATGRRVTAAARRQPQAT